MVIHSRFFISEKKNKKTFFFLSRDSGLCTILRSEAGGQEEAGELDEESYRNNAHLLPPGQGQRSNHVAYYDAAALYPSSGKRDYVIALLGREGEGKEGKKETQTTRAAPVTLPTTHNSHLPFPPPSPSP